MTNENSQYSIPNRAVPFTLVASTPINDNTDYIQNALNTNYDLISLLQQQKGLANGIATLDENGKLKSEQLPSQVINQIFEVSSLQEQLNLPASVGDICKRTDTNTTYILRLTDPTVFTNWMEISGTIQQAESFGVAPFTKQFTSTDWTLTNTEYSIIITSEEHFQGNTNFLHVDVKHDNKSIDCVYEVSNEGTVTIYSQTAFDGDLIISNLSGNIRNTNIVPYSIMFGNNNILTNTFNTINLITNPPVVIIDGFNNIRTINSAVSTVIYSLPEGEYSIFIDSLDIQNNVLTKLTYIPKNNYLGNVDSLPSGTNGQRCYVNYDKTYIFENEWVPKAFTLIGEFTYENNGIYNVRNYPFRQNNLNVNSQSTCFDYLYNEHIKGAEITITNNNLIISSGKCFGTTKLINIPNIQKTFTSWSSGNNNGCFDNTFNSTITIYEVTDGNTSFYTNVSGIADDYVLQGTLIYNDVYLLDFYNPAGLNEFTYTGNTQIINRDTTGWANIFAISGNTTDIICSFNNIPTLPEGYYEYRRIGYLFKDNTVKQQKQFGNGIYFLEPLSNINLPAGTGVILKINNPTNETIDFYTTDNYLLYTTDSSMDTIKLETSDIVWNTNNTEIAVLGYTDKRNNK